MTTTFQDPQQDIWPITHRLPALRSEGHEVMDAAFYLIAEELRIAERLERKAREQWQLVAFFTPLATGAVLAAIAAAGIAPQWTIAIGAVSIVTVLLLLGSMFLTSWMSDAHDDRGLNPERLQAYITDLDQRRTDLAVNQVRAALAESFVEVGQARGKANDKRRSVLFYATWTARCTFTGTVLTLVLAAVAVMVNA